MKKLLFLCCTIVLLFAFSLSAAEIDRPNVVIILADDLGYGDVGCYGAKRVQTPNMDRLAAQGIRFTDAHAVSATCTPSRYALLTGQYPWRKPGTGILPGDAALIIPPGSVTLPSMMKKAGYATGVVGKWHLGLGEQGKPIDWNGKVEPGPNEIGFDYSFIIPATGDRTPCVFVENHHVVGHDPNDPITVSYRGKVGNDPTGRENPELLKMGLDHGHDCTIVNGISRIGYMSGGKAARWVDEDIADTITSKACKFIENNKDKPFFLYFPTHDIHVPRVPHPRFVGKTAMGPRGDAIVQFDWSVGEVLDTLDRLGLVENTIVIMSSDNGPVLNDGYLDQAVELLGDHTPWGPLRGGKYSAFEAGTRVPFLVRWPAGIKKPGATSDALLSLMDVPASLAAITKQTVAPETLPDSENVLPALTGESQQGREFLVLDGASMGLREGIWKMILPSRCGAIAAHTMIETGCNPDPQIYKLDADLGERNNIAENEPERWDRMRRVLQRTRTQHQIDPNQVVVKMEKPETRLDFTFDHDEGTKIVDSSGKENNGTANGTTAETVDGKPARRFDGKGFIDVKKSPSLVFARTPWTTEIVFQSEQPSGVLLAVGASAQGYSVELDKNRLVFSATVSGEIWRIISPEPVEGICKATAFFTADKKMILYQNGKKVGEQQLPMLVPSEPMVPWRIGAMTESGKSPFTGLIYSAKLSAGAIIPE